MSNLPPETAAVLAAPAEESAPDTNGVHHETRSSAKRGSLHGGALTDEALSSSRRVLSRARGNKQAFVGLQQYFTPPEAARLIRGVFGHVKAVLDPTAGAGDLLAPYPERARFGIEIDPDHAGGAFETSYAAIQADAQNVVPMLRAAGARWPTVVLNPPFGLGWRDPAHSKKGEINSTLLAFLWAHDLMDRYGQGAMISGTERLGSAVLGRPEARGIYAIVDVEGPLFDGVSLPTSIVFFVRPENLGRDVPNWPTRLAARREDLDDPGTVRELRSARERAARLVTDYPPRRAPDRLPLDDLGDAFEAVAAEDRKRRQAAEDEHLSRSHDLDLKGKKVRVRLSPFAKLSLAQKGTETRALELLNGQNVQYFGQNGRAWRQVKEARDSGLLTVSSALEERAEKAIEEAEKISTPLFPLKAQLRLGWLSDLDWILCTKGCPERGYVAGESYPIATNQKVETATEQRVVENKHGEHELRRFTTERKLLRVTVGAHSFDEGKQNIAYLAEHFELPDPGCVKSRHPEEVARNRAVLGEIAAENGFEFKEFQIDHLSRLLVKGRGVLAHEQGLGKCCSAETAVLIDGAPVTAEQAWERFAASDGRFDGEGYWATTSRPLHTTALAGDGRLVQAPISRLYRQKVSEWGRRVTLDDGSSITITNAHKLHGADDWTLDVEPGDRVAVPRRILWGGASQDPQVAELLAWQIAEGWENPKNAQVAITQRDRGRLEHLRTLARSIGSRYGLRMNSLPIADPYATHRALTLKVSSRDYRLWLESEMSYGWGRLSAHKRIPDRIVAADDATIRAFLRAFMAAEASVSTNLRVVEVSSASRELMGQLSTMLRRFGIWLRISEKSKRATNGSRTMRTYHVGLIGGESLRLLADKVGIDDPKKSARLTEVASKRSNTNVGGVPVADVLQEARESSRLPWLHLTPSRAYAFNSGGASPDAARRIAAMLRDCASEGAGTRWRGPKGQPPYPATLAAYESLDRDGLMALAARLQQRADRGVHYARVVSVEPVWLEDWVYDFEVPEHHSYVAGGMLAHNTVMQMAIAEAVPRIFPRAKRQALFVSPQDLIDQTQREARKFFGRELEEIRTPAQARDVARRVRKGEEGWWITHYELLSLVGRKKTLLPVAPLPGRLALLGRLHEHRERKKERAHRTNAAATIAPGAQRSDPPERPPMAPTSMHACPSCRATARDGWDGESCPKCSYAHRSRYQKAAYAHLTTAFKDGIVCVDELSEIRGDDSLRSKSIRALARGPHRFGGTGTPISNYVNDCYWGLWFALGDASPAFPYDYANGKARFEADFCVIEYMHGREKDGEEHLRKRRKVLPCITNVSQFWRLVQPSVSRCRKEGTGEPLVEKTYYPIRVPLGKGQQAMNAFWLDRFPDFFKWRNPEHQLVAQGLVEKWAAALGQLWRLETASTLPASDEPTREWPEAREVLGEPSNWTPATLKVLELAKHHAEKGEKVLIGSDLIMTGRWIADRLNEKGVRATHITEEKSGKIATKNPRKRAAEVASFVVGDTQVLTAGVQALKLGHNLDVASVVILHGLPYSLMAAEQFLARVHRLTSKKPVSVYIVIPRNSIAERKWNLLKDKGDAADLAFDGELSVQNEEVVDWNKVLREMREQGIRANGDEVLEADVEAAWAAVPALAPPTPKLPPPPRRGNSPARPHRPAQDASGYVQASLF